MWTQHDVRGLNGKAQLNFGIDPTKPLIQHFQPCWPKEYEASGRPNFVSGGNKHYFCMEDRLYVEPWTPVKYRPMSFVATRAIFLPLELWVLPTFVAVKRKQPLFQKRLKSPSQGFLNNSSAQRNSTGMCLKLTNIFSSSERYFGFSNEYLFRSYTIRDFSARYLFIWQPIIRAALLRLKGHKFLITI